MSKRETILARVATALAGTTGVGSRIYRSRVTPLARGESPAIVVEPVNDTPTQDTLATLLWSMTIRVAVIVRASVPDQAADAIVTEIHSKLMGDATLNGLVVSFLPGNTSFEILEADQPAGVISLEFQAQYRTALESIS